MGRPKTCNPCCGVTSGSSGRSRRATSSSRFSFSGSSLSDTDACCQDNIFSSRYAFDIFGVVNGSGCSDALCNAHNGSRILTVTGTTGIISFQGATYVSCSYFIGDTWAWLLTIDCTSILVPNDGQIVSLQCQRQAAPGANAVTYQTTYYPLPNDCLVPMTLSKTFEGTLCSGFPDSAVITPV